MREIEDANGLDDKGYDVASAENPELECWCDGGVVWAFEADELTKDDVCACCKEGWG